MFKIFSNYFIYCVFVLFLILMPQNVLGAELTFRVIPNTDIRDTTTLVEIRMDPQPETLNVVEGEIIFSGTASDNLSVQFENGQSILPIWPTSPQYDKDRRYISFTGGIPNGFDSEGLLFSLRLSSTVSGTLNISYVNGSAYLNDGKGTKLSVPSKSLNISLGKEEKNKIGEVLFDFDKNKYVIIILLILVVLVVIFKYAPRKTKK